MLLLPLEPTSSQLWLTSRSGAHFLPLGAKRADDLDRRARGKITGDTRSCHPDIWGTLGPWDEHSPLGLTGALELSREGNDRSLPAESGEPTIELIDDVRAGMAGPGRARERFLNLSELKFTRVNRGHSIGTQPALRLTLFLSPDEGALVYLQHGRLGDGGTEYLTPESTGITFDCSKRDRLTYRIPLPLRSPIRSARHSGSDVQIELEDRSDRVAPGTVVKVLTFPRQNGPSYEVVRRALGKIGVGAGHRLVRWERATGAFVPAEAVRRDARTLLLLHGTFSSTTGSFAALAEGPRPLLARLPYEQILGFEHDTVLSSLVENAAHLRALTGGFAQPLDVLTHSRGGLLGKQLAIREPGLEVRRAVLGACANGVGYLSAARLVAMFLSVLKRLLVSSPGGALVTAIAQHSIEFITTLPGLRAMAPGSPELAAVANSPVDAGRYPTAFLPIVGDFDRQLVEHDGYFKRLGATGLDPSRARLRRPTT